MLGSGGMTLAVLDSCDPAVADAVLIGFEDLSISLIQAFFLSITPDGGGKDLFVHFSAILNDGFKTLDNGARVAYEVRDGRNGQEAFDVRVVPFN